MTDKNLLTFRNMSIAGLIAGILTACFIPVYTDEIGWRFQERAGFDGVDKLFSDICGPNTLAHPPFFMMPVREFSALFNSAFADPAWVRVSGIAYALVIAWLTVLLIGRVAPGSRERNLLTAFGVGLAALGMMPMLLAWSRPEQPILIATLAALLLANGGRTESAKATAAAAWLRSLAILALWIVAVSYHLKGLFLLPVFALSLLFCCAGTASRLPRLLVAAAGLLVTVLAAQYWLDRMACPDSVVLRKAFSQNSIGAEIGAISSMGDAWNLVLKMLGNVTLLGYVVHTVPSEFPLSNWLPARQISEHNSFTMFLGAVVLWGFALIAGIAAWLAVIVRAVRHREVDRRFLFALACAITIVGWSATQNWRNVYEAPFVVLLLVLTLVFLLAASGISGRAAKPLALLAAVFAILAFANPLMLGALWGPAMARAWTQTGFVKEQPYSVALRGYPSVRREIMETAKLCRLPQPGQARGVLVDEVTYFAYMESRLPQHRLGVLSVWNGEIRDPVAYLESRKSDGLLVGCHLLEGDVRKRATQHGRFCCLRLDGEGK